MDTRKHSRKKTLVFLVSIVLHTLLIYIVFFDTTPHKKQQSIQQKQSPKHKEMLAAILAQSQQPAPATVMFKNPSSDFAKATTDRQAPPKPKPQPKPEAPKKEIPTPTRIKQLQSIPIKHKMVQARTDPSRNPYRRKYTPQLRATLKNLTQGYLQSKHNERGAMPNSALDMKQLTRQRYTTRVWTMLKNSFRSHAQVIHINTNVKTRAVLSITLGKDGSLLNMLLKHTKRTNNIQQIEKTLLTAAKTTGLYPPIPNEFDSQTITLNFPLAIDAKAGFHKYELFYN